MHENAFANMDRKPSEPALAKALGPAKPLWDDLICQAREIGVADQEWKSYSRKLC